MAQAKAGVQMTSRAAARNRAAFRNEFFLGFRRIEKAHFPSDNKDLVTFIVAHMGAAGKLIANLKKK